MSLMYFCVFDELNNSTNGCFFKDSRVKLVGSNVDEQVYFLKNLGSIF